MGAGAGGCGVQLLHRPLKVLSTVIYIAMGWLVIVAIKPMWASIDGGTLAWLFAGGLSHAGHLFLPP